MKAYDVGVFRYPMGSPDDVSELKKLIESGAIKVQDLAAIIAQTEGDGYARGYSTLAHLNLLSPLLNKTPQQVFDDIPMLMIGLTAGIMSPHAVAFTTSEVEVDKMPNEKRLSIGVVNTREYKPEEIGSVTHVDLVAEAVREGMAKAGIESIDDVHCVEVKCPGMTPARMADAKSRGAKLYVDNMNEINRRSKGASALGVAVGLGEVARDKITEDAICSDWSLYSNVATTSAGGEQRASRVIVMGNSKKSASKYVIASGVMKDQIDLPAAKAVLRKAELKIEDQLDDNERKRFAAGFLNAAADELPQVRGRRHTIHSDFLAGYAGIIAKAVINAIFASLVGDTMVLASAGWEHQGPRGANLIAVIAEAQ